MVIFIGELHFGVQRVVDVDGDDWNGGWKGGWVMESRRRRRWK